MEKIYYVYIYLDPRKFGSFLYGEYSFDYEPFYVGKGKDSRIHEHLQEYSLRKYTYKNNKIKKILSENLKPIALKIKENLTNEEALSLEISLIKLIGRGNLNEGPLTNNTNGGESSTGAIYSCETRALMSSMRKGKKQTPAQYTANVNRIQTPESRRRISEAQKGIKRLTNEQYAALGERRRGTKMSDATRQKMSQQRKGKKQTPAQLAATMERARIRKEKLNFVTFEEYKIFVRSLPPEIQKARNLVLYLNENKIPRMPRSPNTAYKDKWISWNNLFGRDQPKTKN